MLIVFHIRLRCVPCFVEEWLHTMLRLTQLASFDIQCASEPRVAISVQCHSGNSFANVMPNILFESVALLDMDMDVNSYCIDSQRGK